MIRAVPFGQGGSYDAGARPAADVVARIVTAFSRGAEWAASGADVISRH